jgi:hypothetical protein
MRGLFYAALILAFVFGNMITVIAAGTLFVVRFVIQLSIINGSAKHFGNRKFFLTLPLFDVYLPILSFYLLTFGRMTSKGKTVRWK